MVTTAPTYPMVEEQRYLALLRAANAIATSSDCDCASAALVEKLKEVSPFDFIHVATFDKETNLPCWSMLDANGKRLESTQLDDLSSEHLRFDGFTKPDRHWLRTIGTRRLDFRHTRLFLPVKVSLQPAHFP